MSRKDVDLRYISLGAGVQSSTMYLMALHGLLTPKPDCAIFADTQVEPPWVYEQLDFLEGVQGIETIPIYRATAGNLGEALSRAIDGKSGRFASIPFWVLGEDGRHSPGRRQCTREYKIDVVKRTARELLGLKPGERAAGRIRVEEWVGISTDEASRAKPSRYSWIETRWPLLFDRSTRRSECRFWLEQHDYPQPTKSACVFCPYHDNATWRMIRAEHPSIWDLVCQIDRDLRASGTMKGMRREQFMHTSLTPLQGAPIDVADQIDLFKNECEGMCGV